MYALQSFKQEVKSVLEKATGETIDDKFISITPNLEMGDLSSNIAFVLAKKQGKKPNEIAMELLSKIKISGMISEAKVEGPYINFFAKQDELGKQIVLEAQKPDYGNNTNGKGKTALIEYSSINIAKPLGIHHLRSTIIGHAIYNLHKTSNYKTIGINHLGDIGDLFGKIIAAYKRWGNEKELTEKPLDHLLDLYVRFGKEVTKDEALEDEARSWNKKLHEQEPEAIKLWERFKKVSLKEVNETYDRLGIKFDSFKGEAYYVMNGLDKKAAQNLIEKKVAVTEEDGTIVVKLENYNLTNARIIRSDGTTLYIARDLAAAVDRYNEYKFDKNIYVVANQQTLHFEQLFKTLELAGYEWAKNCAHVKFGFMSSPEGTFATRKGNIVHLVDVLDAAVAKASEIVEEKNPSLSPEEKKDISEAVGLGAVVFNDLSQNRIKDIVFDINKAVSFEGDTGPYLQYAHARCNQILEKAGTQGNEFKITKLEEKQLFMKLGKYPEIVINACEKYEPHLIAQYLLELTHLFNSFYEECPILKAEDTEKATRIQLVTSVKNTLKQGLGILGIKALDKM